MKYFIIGMYALWIGLTLILAVKEQSNEDNTNSN
jgi:hypothetical protein